MTAQITVNCDFLVATPSREGRSPLPAAAARVGSSAQGRADNGTGATTHQTGTAPLSVGVPGQGVPHEAQANVRHERGGSRRHPRDERDGRYRKASKVPAGSDRCGYRRWRRRRDDLPSPLALSTWAADSSLARCQVRSGRGRGEPDPYPILGGSFGGLGAARSLGATAGS